MTVNFQSHFEITPKAFANFSPGLERSDNPGKTQRSLEPCKGSLRDKPFQSLSVYEIEP